MLHLIHKQINRPCWLILSTLCALASCEPKPQPYNSWEVYKGGPEANNYSALKQINRENVQNLKVAWSFYPNDETEDFKIWKYECNPIIVGNVMYLASAKRYLYAIDAGTGEKIWSFDPLEGDPGGGVLRGVTYWEGSEGPPRVFITYRNRLYCVNAETGEAIKSFGKEGKILLDIPQPEREEPGTVRASSPGIVYENLIIMGASVSESAGAAPGYVRAYNVLTGELIWTFHTIPKPGEFGYDTWPEEAYKYSGGANNWAGMSLDLKNGLVFVPTGSPTYDYYAGDRLGANLFGNCVIALDAATGEYRWHYQTVHHDIWDYDLPTAPNLITVKQADETIEAIAQPTKQGFIFVLDRKTGKPIFPVEERPVPESSVKGEEAWPTQPFPLKPASFARQSIETEEIMDFSPEQYEVNKKTISDLRFEGLYTPPDEQGTLLIPGSRGGAEWGGAAYDVATGVLYINSNESPEVATISKVDKSVADNNLSYYKLGKQFYEKHCIVCHGDEKQGVEANPSLISIGQRLSAAEILQKVKEGAGIMPSFDQLVDGYEEAIVAYLTETRKFELVTVERPDDDTSSVILNTTAHGYLLDSLNRPIIKPPWGTLNAIDMNTGDYLWKIPLGSHPEYQKPGEPDTGIENYGGPVVTAGGLVFIASTMDGKFRAFDKDSGALLWENKMPGNGLATPAVYELDGKQYISIAVGIVKESAPAKSGIITFSLP